jgi:PhnB protein
MKSFQPYLNFDGNTREAMTFYHQALGGDFFIQTFAEANVPGPPGSENRIMHAAITKGVAILMASDTMPGHEFAMGTNVHVNIDCDDVADAERCFNALSGGASITMPLQETFWAKRFGMLVDKFGVHWMFNYAEKTA